MGTHPDILVDSKTLGGRGNNGNFDLLKLRPIVHAHTTHTQTQTLHMHTYHTCTNAHILYYVEHNLLSIIPLNRSLCQPDHLKDSTIATCGSPLLFIVSLLVGSAAMLCKENGITSLGVCLCYDVFVVCGAGIRQ